MQAVSFLLGLFIGSLAAVGLGVGWYKFLREETGGEEEQSGNLFRNNETFIRQVLDEVQPEKIRQYLNHLTEKPHMAGSNRDLELTKWIKSEWEENGLDNVYVDNYLFHLSWPNQTNPNKIYVIDDKDRVRYTTRHMEHENLNDDFVHAFNAYAPAGDISGDVVYVNFGDTEDFLYLQSKNISVQGKICMARYGKLYRGNKVVNCRQKGGIGMILFSDPEQFAAHGTRPVDVYPNTRFLPGTGIQRGSINLEDPLSPGWPSVKNAYKLKPTQDGKIPTQPIGYDDAECILNRLGGEKAPSDWQGKIPGLTYFIGGEMNSQHVGWKVRLVVNNYEGEVENGNVIGVIKGEIEPDKYVLVGNHRDAWGYGAVDPSSGTAQLMEAARVLGKMRQAGWKPRRTIVFCSWAAEEHGIHGSNEWVEHKRKKLMDRAVAYINVDICVSGPILRPEAFPVLSDVILEALKAVPDPFEGQYLDNVTPSGDSYYDFWYDWLNQNVGKGSRQKPKVSLLGSGSDHYSFAFMAGIPSMSYTFMDDSKKYPGSSKFRYPTYHSGYETFDLVDRILDPGFKISKTCAKTTLHIALQLSDSVLLPLALRNSYSQMSESISSMKRHRAKACIDRGVIDLSHIEGALMRFSDAISSFELRKENVDQLDDLQVSQINNQMMQLERIFLLAQGLPGRPYLKHAVFAPSYGNVYDSSAFPGLLYLLDGFNELEGSELEERTEKLKRHVSDLMILINNAADFLDYPEII